MHILFACNEYPPASCGGIGIFTKLLAEGLAERGIAVTVAGMYVGIEDERWEEQNGVTVVRLPNMRVGKLSPFLNRMRFYRWVQKYISTYKVNIVEYPDFHSQLFMRHSVPVVLRLHGGNLFCNLHGSLHCTRASAFFEKRAIRTADCIVGVSQYVLDYTLNRVQNNPTAFKVVIHNFTDTTRFRPTVTNEKKNKILYFGAIAEHKGVLVLARAANIFLRALPGAQLYFIGRDAQLNGKNVNIHIAEIIKPDLAQNVIILPPLNNIDLFEEISKAVLCVFPSRMEAFGLTIIESMACGTPVIASNCGPIPEIISNGYDGLLVDPDNVEALATSVIRLYNDTELQKTLGQHARETVLNTFDKDDVIEKNVTLYKNMLS